MRNRQVLGENKYWSESKVSVLSNIYPRDKHDVLFTRWFYREISGAWFNIKMPSYQHRKPNCGDNTLLRPLISTMGFPILVRWHLHIEYRAQAANPLEFPSCMLTCSRGPLGSDTLFYIRITLDATNISPLKQVSKNRMEIFSTNLNWSLRKFHTTERMASNAELGSCMKQLSGVLLCVSRHHWKVKNDFLPCPKCLWESHNPCHLGPLSMHFPSRAYHIYLGKADKTSLGYQMELFIIMYEG